MRFGAAVTNAGYFGMTHTGLSERPSFVRFLDSLSITHFEVSTLPP